MAPIKTKGDDFLVPLRPIPEERTYFFFELFFFAAGFFAAFLAGFFVAMNYSPIEQNLREWIRAGLVNV
ncbi:MAG: hypothetical protein ACRD1Y_05800 [Terriglobales bacterium]